jgi:hypothetical protein
MMNISIPDSIESRLVSEAQRLGLDASQYAQRLLEQALATPSVDEVLAPFRKQVADSGLSDEQLDSLFQNARDKAWKQRQGDRK